MKNYTGAMGGRTVQRVSLESEFDAYEPNLAEGKYRVSCKPGQSGITKRVYT